MTVPGQETVYNFKDLLAQAKTASFEALPIGNYDVEIHEATAVTSSTQKPMIKIKAKVFTGPHTKRTVMTQFTLSVDNAIALNIFFRNLRAFGLTDEWLTAIGGAQDLTPIAQALVGRKATFKLKQKTWQGELRNEVEGVFPLSGAPSAPPQMLPGSGPIAGVPTGGGAVTVTPPPPPPQGNVLTSPPGSATVAQSPVQPPTPTQVETPVAPPAAPPTPPPPPAQQVPAQPPVQATPPPPPVQDVPQQPAAAPEQLPTPPPPPPLQF